MAIKVRKISSWIEETKIENEHAEELLECRLIVLKIVRFMKNNHLSQKDLAERLNVSPQYINKFLHGQILDMKVSTVLRYGRILGIKLLEVPSDNSLEECYNHFLELSDLFTKKNTVFIASSPFDYSNNCEFIQPLSLPAVNNTRSNCKPSKAN